MADSRSNPSKPSVAASLVVVRRKKGEDHDAHHGGAWKIAYADFVTAMMAFFLLMWLLGSVSKYDKQGIEDYFNAPLSTLLSGGQDAQAPRPSVVQGRPRHVRPDAGDQRESATGAGQLARRTRQHRRYAKLERLKAKLTAAIAQKPVVARVRTRSGSRSPTRACASRSSIR